MHVLFSAVTCLRETGRDRACAACGCRAEQVNAMPSCSLPMPACTLPGVLQELSPFKNCVIATGGGVPTRAENWGHMQASALAEWSDVCPVPACTRPAPPRPPRLLKKRFC